MKLRYILPLLIFFVCVVNVDAESRIEYNLNIDKELQFYENIKYYVDYSDIDHSSYNHLTSVVEDTIYFDNDKSVKYVKSKVNTGSQYIVTLKNSYSSMFLGGQRILNECFKSFKFKDDADEISVETENPFFCLNRADNIVVRIKTDLVVSSSNADSSSNGVYLWNITDRNFSLRFGVKVPDIEDDPLSGNYEDGEDETDNIDKNITNTEGDANDKSMNENNFILGIVIAVSLIVLFIAGIIVFIILKQKKNKLNEL